MPTPVSTLKLFLTGLYLLVWPILIVGLGGDLRWVEGWLFSGWFVAVCASVIGWLYRKDPALLAERYRPPGSGGQSQRDQLVVYLLLAGFIAWIVLMPLDARRFRWTAGLPLSAELLGGACLMGAWFLLFRSFVDNTFLSPLVRVQAERRQSVVTTGVYAIVRHPMYLGATLMFIGAPLMLGSLVGLVPGLALVAIVATRILDEEKLLVVELAGYEEYRRRVRYRLIPFVW